MPYFKENPSNILQTYAQMDHLRNVVFRPRGYYQVNTYSDKLNLVAYEPKNRWFKAKIPPDEQIIWYNEKEDKYYKSSKDDITNRMPMDNIEHTWQYNAWKRSNEADAQAQREAEDRSLARSQAQKEDEGSISGGRRYNKTKKVKKAKKKQLRKSKKNRSMRK